MPDKECPKDTGTELMTRGRLEIKAKEGVRGGHFSKCDNYVIKLDGKEITDAYELKLLMTPNSLPRVEIGFFCRHIDIDAKAMAFLLDLPVYEDHMEELYNGKTPKDGP